MQKQEISNIMIFFVTQDLEGQPRQLEMHLMPEKEVSMMNQRFTEYLQRQREMYKPSLVQSHLPDLYLCRYQFPAGVSYPDIRLFDKDNSLVQKFITRNGGSMQGNVSLRGLEYLHSHDEEKSLPMLVASGLADHLLVQPEAKRFALAQDTLHDDPSETLTAVETAKGVLLFEYSGFGKTCCHAYMQHLADRFFTPEVQALGRIREFYISCPNHSTEHYMQKHLDLFRSNPFYGQLAKMPLYPIEQSELLKKGGYPIEPTYHAFKQFTEDYRLSVTPENAEIFTLLFIREYRLPADFNTNESYKEFTHKGNFKPLDQEMSELQSKKGYSEKAFYNIQNRQQQLADKILGLRYRLTCPPLQLTGPAASEKRKTASRQNKSHNPRI